MASGRCRVKRWGTGDVNLCWREGQLLFSLFAREEGLLPPGLCYDARLSSGKCSKCAQEGGHTAVQGYPALGFSSYTVSDS